MSSSPVLSPLSIPLSTSQNSLELVGDATVRQEQNSSPLPQNDENLSQHSLASLHNLLSQLKSQISSSIQLNYSALSSINSHVVSNIQRDNENVLGYVREWHDAIENALNGELHELIEEKQRRVDALQRDERVRRDVKMLVFVERVLLGGTKNADEVQLVPCGKTLNLSSGEEASTANDGNGNSHENTHPIDRRSASFGLHRRIKTSTAARTTRHQHAVLYESLQTILANALLIQQIQALLNELSHVEQFTEEEREQNAHTAIIYDTYVSVQKKVGQLRELFQERLWLEFERALHHCIQAAIAARAKFGNKNPIDDVSNLDALTNAITHSWKSLDVQMIQTCLDAVAIAREQEWFQNTLRDTIGKGITESTLYSIQDSKAEGEKARDEFFSLTDSIMTELENQFLPLRVCLSSEHNIQLLEKVIWPSVQPAVQSSRDATSFKDIFERFSSFLSNLEDMFILSEEELQQFRASILDYERKWNVQVKMYFTIIKQKLSKRFDSLCLKQQAEIPSTILNRTAGKLYLTVPCTLWEMLTQEIFHSNIFLSILSDKFFELLRTIMSHFERWATQWVQTITQKANLQLVFVLYQDVQELERLLHSELISRVKGFMGAVNSNTDAQNDTETHIDTTIESIAKPVFAQIYAQIGEKCIQSVTEQCTAGLKVLQTSYSVTMSQKPEKPTYGMTQLLVPLQTFLNSIDIDDEDPQLNAWKRTIIQRITTAYFDTCTQSLETARKLYINIKKLQKKTNESDSNDDGTQGIRQQIALDVEEYRNMIQQRFGVAQDDIPQLKAFDSEVGA